MYKEEYLEALDRLLSSLSYNERREIMYDYEEHFKEGTREGLTDDEIISSLGTPEKIASSYVSTVVPVTPIIDYTIKEDVKPQQSNEKKQPRQKYGNSIGEIIAYSIIALIFNSLIIGFYLGFWGVLIAFTVVGITLLFGGFTLLISTLVATPLAVISAPAMLLEYPVLLVAGSIIMICIGGLTLIVMYYFIRFTCILTYRYISWLIRWIRGF